MKGGFKTVFSLWFFAFPLFRAEHRRNGRIKALGLPVRQRLAAGGSESRRSFSEGGASFRVLRPLQPVDAASIVLSGKATGEVRRAAIARL